MFRCVINSFRTKHWDSLIEVCKGTFYMLSYSRKNLGWLAQGSSGLIVVIILLLAGCVNFKKPPLAPEQVGKIAKTRTVLIRAFLKKNDNYELKSWGSGVIVASQQADQNTVYTVLTNDHVVCIESEQPEVRCDDRLQYAVYTFDNKSYWLRNITRFGETLEKFDLALAIFDSSIRYESAMIGDSNKIQVLNTIYVAGYPSHGSSTSPVLEVSAGSISSLPRSERGYGIDYTVTTWKGMSGGPVFNSYGQLIGIHGQARMDWRDVNNVSTTEGVTPFKAIVETGFNQAIPINTLIEVVKQTGTKIAGLALENDKTQLVSVKADLPHTFQEYNQRGLQYVTQGELKAAEQDFTTALKLNSQSAETYFNQGTLYLKQQNWSSAEKSYNEAIRLAPNYLEAYLNRGFARWKTGNTEGAIADYDQASKINSNYAPAALNRANIYALMAQETNQTKNRTDGASHGGGYYYDDEYSYTSYGDDTKDLAISNYQKAAKLFKQQGMMQEYRIAMQNLEAVQKNSKYGTKDLKRRGG